MPEMSRMHEKLVDIVIEMVDGIKRITSHTGISFTEDEIKEISRIEGNLPYMYKSPTELKLWLNEMSAQNLNDYAEAAIQTHKDIYRIVQTSSKR